MKLPPYTAATNYILTKLAFSEAHQYWHTKYFYPQATSSNLYKSERKSCCMYKWWSVFGFKWVVVAMTMLPQHFA